ncbi:CRISPR-associated endonuclease Cas2 [Pseudonocardia phyllosphaerae]|uniref:CRISPR-associated endonuclease Cas2 n=1 Tax=Pseudonocardia phyllosphaerae TaxID=3390502 RepID=UPI00397B917B
MSDVVHRYVLAYDVTSDNRRVRVAKKLESYGDRLQYSVFLVDIKPARMVRLKAAVTACLEAGVDSLLICDLGPLVSGHTHRVEFIGARRSFTPHGPIIL